MSLKNITLRLEDKCTPNNYSVRSRAYESKRYQLLPDVKTKLSSYFQTTENFSKTARRALFNYFIDSAFGGFISDQCLQFVFSSCDQGHYNNSVQLVSAVIRSKVDGEACLQDALSRQKSVENGDWVCNNCVRSLLKKKLSPQSRLNGFFFTLFPAHIRNLIFAEREIGGSPCFFLCA